MKQNNMPILHSLKKYAEECQGYFHMPGHKGGKVFKKAGLEDFDLGLLAMDVTEVPGIDNLHCPEGAILEAQELAAHTFGADHSFFLVNGTTAGIYSMILAATKPGDKIIVPRNCHKAVTGALILGRLQPVYITPEIHGLYNIASGIAPHEVRQAIEDHPDAKAVVITNPTFYGVCSDLEQLAALAHEKNMLLLVDEAHGAHFAFHRELPKTALQCGADMVAQSTHKTLPSMTQSSMLHVKGGRADLDKVKFFLQLTQSTSPSHILMASLDAARYVMEQKGEELLEEVIGSCNRLRQELSGSGVYCLGRGDMGREGIYDIDATRLTVNFSRRGISGTQADRFIRNKFKLQVEMSDLYNIVAICSVGDSPQSITRLAEAILAASQENQPPVANLSSNAPAALKSIPAMKLLPWEAIYMQKEELPAKASLGRVSGEMIVPYPPGIPILMPGEVITGEVLDYARECRENGIKINGAKDASLKTITVLK
jgi:arginine/lysine/ornithine decarboxylase